VVADVSRICAKDWFKRSSTFRTKRRTGTKSRSWTSRTCSDVSYQELWVILGHWRNSVLVRQCARTHASHACSVDCPVGVL